MMNAWESEKPMTGRTVMLAIAGFFAVVFAVNGVFLWLALGTNTGVVANEPYRKGLKYNERIAADERQIALGWTSEIFFDAADSSLVAVLSDRDGTALKGLLATATIGRGATDREDVAATLTETAPGRYAAKVPVHLAGSYVANLDIADPTDAPPSVVYRARRRLWLKP